MCEILPERWRKLNQKRHGDFDLRGGMAASLMRKAHSVSQANSDDMAGKIDYLAPVDNASGKIFGKKQKFVAVKRLWGNRRRGCAVTGERNMKDHPLTANELAIRAKFKSVQASTRARLADPELAATDMAAWKAQTEYTTLWRYVWHLEWLAYEA